MKILEDPLLHIPIAGQLFSVLSEPSIDLIEYVYEYSDDKKLHRSLVAEKSAFDLLYTKSLSNHLPANLPMTVEPKPYSYDHDKIVLGGYLNNDNFYSEDLFINKVGYRDFTKVCHDSSIIKLVNGISRVAFKINKDCLDFIDCFGVEFGIIQDPYSKDMVDFRRQSGRLNRNSLEFKNLASKASTIDMETHILSIAKVYQTVSKIYFPIRMDQRTRLYCSPMYLNYQSCDLAKSLLLFSKPGVIFKNDTQAIQYFKSYGACLFDDNLGKISFKKRVKYIDEITDYIKGFRYNDIIKKAYNKPCFLAFCFEYERLCKFLDDIDSVKFYTFLPIQLDASCNGYQHISLLTREEKVLKHLNLKESSLEDKPGDFYSYILIEVGKFLKDKLEKEPTNMVILRLTKASLNRSIIKKSIMTYSYNASAEVMVDYIKNLLVRLDEKKPNPSNNNREEYVYIAEGADPNCYLFVSDVYYFVKCFTSIIKRAFPRMHALKLYTKSLVKICLGLNMPLP